MLSREIDVSFINYDDAFEVLVVQKSTNGRQVNQSARWVPRRA
jgi:hypothetical protein